MQAAGGTPISRQRKPKLSQAYDYKKRVTALNNLKLLQRQKLDTIDEKYSGQFKISLRSLGISSKPGTRVHGNDGEEQFNDIVKVPMYVSKDTTRNLTAMDEALAAQFAKERPLPLEGVAAPSLAQALQEREPLTEPGTVRVCAILPRNVISIDTAEKSETIHRSDVLVPDAGSTMEFAIDTMPMTEWRGVVRDVTYTGSRRSGRRMVFITMDNVAGVWI
jgi:hypothetical protein